MKLSSVSFALLSLSVALTACTQPADSGSQANNDTHTTAKTEPLAVTTFDYSADQAKRNGEGKTLTVYAYDSFTSEWGAGPKLQTAFEKDCACTVKFVAFEDGVTMFNRLRLEGKNPQADVIIGLDNNLLQVAEQLALFSPTAVNLSNIRLPIEWNNQTFIPYDYGQYAFIYDKNKLKNPPKSLKELVNRQDISVIYQDPRTSTVGRGLLAWINTVYGDTSEQAWQSLAGHTLTIGKGWSETYGAFLKGEADMVLSYNTSPLYHQLNEQKDNYVSAEFTEGHIVQIELASRLTTSDTPQLAEDFLAFLLSPQAQKTIALSNVMLPVINTPVDPRYDTFKPYTTLDVPMPEDTMSKAQIRQWQQAVSR